MTTLEDDKLTGECQMPMTNVDRVSVLDLQVRLAQKATGDPSHRFGDLYNLLSWETVLDEAATRLLGNKGSRTPGLDSVTRRVLMPDRRMHHIRLLTQQLRDGAFRPSPVKRLYIPKRNGKLRPLGIPTIHDRWVQMALKLILEPIFESDFASFSHGFRPGRSCHTAAAHVVSATTIRKRKYYWVVEGDIEGFFDPAS
jgi:RNA-directed DNA polymerase